MAERADEGDDARSHGEIVKAHWSGPLPPPAHLAEFERILPGAAERIFAQFEIEGNHRRSMERENAQFAAKDATVGQALAEIYAASAFGLTAFAIYMNANWVAS